MSPRFAMNFAPHLGILRPDRPLFINHAGPDPIDQLRFIADQGTDKLSGVLGRLEQRRCRLEHPRDARSMGLFRRLVREALAKIAVENGGPNLKQKMSAPL